MRRARSRCLQGMVLAVGAPSGWLLIRALAGGRPATELTQHPALYLYMLVSTILVFAFFGLLLGAREDRLLELNRRLDQLAVTDDLTGLRNARYFHARLEEAAAHSRRTGEPLALAIIDLDHFKKINDRFGHAAGDEVLVSAARAIASMTRHGETEARVGGEEFALLLPGSTGEEGKEVAERVRRAIKAARTSLPGVQPESVVVTASVGVASTAELPGADPRKLFQAADASLYRAKRGGRNRTAVASPAA
jgi:diguanylate cyclase (GGDEF)-like protein